MKPFLRKLQKNPTCSIYIFRKWKVEEKCKVNLFLGNVRAVHGEATAHGREILRPKTAVKNHLTSKKTKMNWWKFVVTSRPQKPPNLQLLKTTRRLCTPEISSLCRIWSFSVYLPALLRHERSLTSLWKARKGTFTCGTRTLKDIYSRVC